MLAALLICAPGLARAEYGTEASATVKSEAEIKAIKLEKESYEKEKRAIAIRAKIAAVKAQIEELQKKLASLEAELAGSGSTSTDTTVKANAWGKFVSDLAEGSKGEEVRALQLILIKKGLLESDKDTGYYGPMTKEAVRKFQMEKGIDAIGVIGPMTRAKLNSY